MPNPPLQRAVALDPRFYTDDEVYAFETKKLLAQNWQIVAPAELLSGSGDVIVRKLGNVPILITRTPSGELNGFYNICPHRAGPVATCDARGTKRLRCGYHGWAYNHDGALKSAPEMDAAEGFDPKSVSLTPINVAEWNGLIWAGAGDVTAFSKIIAGIDDIIGTHLNGLNYHKTIIYDVDCNWKIYADNYLEGYHLPFVHPGLTQAVDYGDYKTELGDYWSLQRSPIDDDTGAYAAGEALYFFIYPNIMLNILPGRLQTNRIVATSPDTCQVEFDFYYAPSQAHREADDIKFSDQVQEEDRTICEHVQMGLTSGVYKPGRLSPAREAGVWHFQNLLRDAYRAAGL